MSSRALRPGVSTALAAFACVAGLVGTVHYLEIPSLVRQRQKSRKVEPRCYSLENPPSLEAFKVLIDQITLPSTYPKAKEISKNVPIYDCTAFQLSDREAMAQLQDEWYHILISGPGVFVLKHFFPDEDILDATNEAYATIAMEEQSIDDRKGDHFAPASANTRVWNSFSKHCLQDPESFVDYYSNPLFGFVSEAYLGPAYRLTSQLNIVRPGGKAQVCHRDYHLGFQTSKDSVKWPRAMHNASTFLTLQGAVAHTDMPLDSGPTRLLPFSQLSEEGFMAYGLPEFNDLFLEKYTALPLQKGDAIFFSPALFHAAGENRMQGIERSANLIQVSSAFGRPMESIDTLPLIEKSWDVLAERYASEGMSTEVDSFVKAVAEGYPFPTNLDRRPPAPGGLAPESEQDLLRTALREGWEKARLVKELIAVREASAA